MSLTLIGWLFTVGVLLHNAEEALYLPAWLARMRVPRVRVGAREFRFAAAIVSLLVVALAASSHLAPDGGALAHLMAGFALAMVFNAVVPHVVASVATRTYMPGTATAVLLNLPLGLLYLHPAVAEHRIELRTFVWAGPLVAILLAASIPALFALGRRLFACEDRCRTRQRPGDGC